MKFTCPNCNAKYQIADEKVAGRTLKMKCRKCDTYIPITGRAATIAPLPSMSMAPSPDAHFEAPAPEIRGRSAPPPKRATSASSDRLLLSIPGAPTAPVIRDAVGAGVSRLPGAPSMPAPAKAQAPPEPQWYVGIGGKIHGPFGREQLGDSARRGEVGEHTYAWREGMADWRPVPEVPELSWLLELLPAPPSMPAQAKRQRTEPISTAPVAAASPVGSGLAAGRAAGEAAQAAPPASVEEALGFGDLGGPLPGEAPPPVGLGQPALSGAAAGPPPSRAEDWEPGLSALHVPRSRNVTAATIAFAVFAAVGFGLAVGFVLFGGETKTKVIREVVEVPVEVRKVVTGGESGPAAVASAESTGTAPSTGAAARRAGPAGATKGSTAAEPATKPGGLSGLSGLSGLGSSGPAGGPAGGTAAGGSGQPLDSAQIERTVATYRASVKRGCWQPALDARDRSAPSSARVSVAISVAPSGRVTSATSSGDPPGYRGLADCISRKVQTWQFPPSSGATQVNVPFVFAAQ